MNVLFIAHKPEVLSQILQSGHSHSLMMVGQKEKKGKDIDIPCSFKYLFYVLLFWGLIKKPLNLIKSFRWCNDL